LEHWNTPNAGATNESGFTALGAGYRDYVAGNFQALKDMTYFWSITEDGANAYVLELSKTIDTAGVYQYNKINGMSSRLLYEGAGTNIIDVVKIGSQYWTAQNWKCTRLNNGTLIPTITDDSLWAAESGMAKCAYDNDLNNV